MIDYTLWPSLYARTDPYTVRESWPDFVRRFSQHAEYPDKFAAPGFGPYRLVTPSGPCARHGGLAGPHRCDACVAAVTLAVFDVDCGTTDAVATSDAALTCFARLWFSTWSYRPDAPQPSLRLVLPLAEPVPPAAWRYVREQLVRYYRIPADPTKCSGLSHFYFGPSCPTGRLADVVVDTYDGAPLDVSDLVARAPLGAVAPSIDDFWDEVEDDDGPVELGPVRAAIQRRMSSLARGNVKDREKAAWLKAVLAGEPIAEHGSRNDTTNRTAGVLASAAPDASLGALRAIIRPSVDAMIAAGSRRVTYETVDRMLTSALQYARAKRARDLALVQNLGQLQKQALEERRARAAAKAGKALR